ncbi:MAG: HAD family hydrolase [Acidimicrobiia bacterium]
MRLPDRIDAVLLDVGGVFHLPDHERIVAVMARAGVPVDPADLDRAHYAGVKALTDFREGDREIWLAYNRGYAHALGADGRVENVAEVLLNEFTTGGVWTRIIPGSPEALRAIAATGVKLAVVSNADGSVEAQLASDGICQTGPGPGVVMDAVIDSSVVGVAKPDPRIFEIALERCGVAPERAIHVGDTPAADVDGARAAGVTPVLVDPHDDHPDLDVLRVRSLADVAELLARSA